MKTITVGEILEHLSEYPDSWPVIVTTGAGPQEIHFISEIAGTNEDGVLSALTFLTPEAENYYPDFGNL